jgi:hypothetical protein
VVAPAESRGGGGRCQPRYALLRRASGEPPAGARERAVWSTPAGARGGIGTVARPWGLVGARLRPAAACTREGGCGGVARCRGAWRECPAR